MSSSKPTPPSSQAFNDVLAKMMQAEVNEGGPPPATPCDTPVEVISHIHMTDPAESVAGTEDLVRKAKQEFEKMLTQHLDRLRDEICRARAKGVTLEGATKAKWVATMADLDAKQKAVREKLGAATTTSGKAWEHVRDGAMRAWKDLENAIREARSEF
ncbi:MAG: hypothetical protein K8S94_03705 [Planctomycetia bacterium]|nr:hypothetical protein [Planctomycetia bacterium]